MSTKEWLPYVYLSVGPRGGNEIHIRASDVTRTGMINKWTTGIASEKEFYDKKTYPVLSWAAKAALSLEDYVDPLTLNHLKAQCRAIQHRLAAFGGGVWVTPEGIKDMRLQPS